MSVVKNTETIGLWVEHLVCKTVGIDFICSVKLWSIL